jgi:hypothetical protein
MRHNVTRGVLFAALAVVLGLAVVSTAGAFPLRSPQVTIGSSPETSLQTYLTGVGESINVTTDQLDLQTWSTDVSGNALFTLMLEIAGNAPNNTYGVYNANEASPTLFEVFPGNAGPGWFAVVSFMSGGNLVVNLFSPSAGLVGTNSYSGVNSSDFGFYLSGPGGTFYTEDGRNGGVAQALTFAGTGRNYGDWWLAWEDLPPASSDRDFNDAVLLLESIAPVPAETKSWGALKARYR